MNILIIAAVYILGIFVTFGYRIRVANKLIEVEIKRYNETGNCKTHPKEWTRLYISKEECLSELTENYWSFAACYGDLDCTPASVISIFWPIALGTMAIFYLYCLITFLISILSKVTSSPIKNYMVSNIERKSK